MAGTRTAPAFTAAATGRIISIQLIDASGDKYSAAVNVPVAATAANIETLVAKYQAATNASVYNIVDTLEHKGDIDPQNAVSAFRAGKEDGINLSFKNVTTGVTYPSRVIAPVAATMQGDQDIPLVSSTELGEYIAAVLALKSGFAMYSAQYTGRQERKNNPKVVV
jgi:hypothetical protein